jgi:PAS domain S-box-containing protein
MAARVAAFDWSRTPLGPMDAWPQSLRVAVGICMNSRFPMFVWWGPQLINIYNDAYIPVLGKRHPQALGVPARGTWQEIWSVVGPQAEAVMQRGAATWNERVLLVMERHGYREDTYFTWSYSPILDESGRIGGLFCACTEETQRVRAEADRDRLLAQLDAERQRLTDVFEQSPAFLAVLRGPEHVFDLVNDRYGQLIGRKDVVGKRVRDALPEVVGQGFFELLDRVYATGEPFVGTGMSVTLQRFPGGPPDERVVDFVYQPVRDENGSVSGILVHGVDVTDHRRAEQALRESEERLRAVFQQTEAGIAQVDLAGRFVLVNDRYCQIVGRAREELFGLRMQDLTHPEDLPRNIAMFEQSLRSGSPFVIEKRYVRPDGSDVWVSNSVSVMRGRDGRPAGILAASVDITDRKRTEAALRQAKDEAERASDAKSEFLATLSHELRTPLTPVLLTVSLMESNPELPAELREDVALIRRNVELESRLISDLLDLTRIERGKLQLDMQDVDLHLIVRSAIDICQREASAKLTVDLRATRHTVRGDSVRLQQIFWNLINNAQKFTKPEGTITVRSFDTPGGAIRVEVADTGAGIDAAVLPRLFNAFEQGEVRAVRQQAGLGLGLAISRRLAEAHGGTIGASSAGRGQGATFAVELPVVATFEPDMPRPRNAPAERSTRSLAVLLVEDHEATLTVMTKLLRGLGHRVTGVSTVASATAAANQDAFDLIISDLGLPDGSGLDVMRQLRDRYAGRAIALTGYGMESDVVASRDAGFAEHLTKPVDLAALQGAIHRVAAAAKRE